MSLRSDGSLKSTLERQAKIVACAFAASLHGGKDTQTTEALRIWLEESSIHRKVWEQVSDTLEASHGLQPELLKRLVNRLLVSRVTRIPIHRRPKEFAIVACSVILLGLAFVQVAPLNQTTYATQVGEQRTILLADGTRLTLDTATRVRVQYNEHIRRIVLESGATFFDVAHEPTRPFSVLAGEHKVIALGTSFVVRRNSQSEQNLSVTLVKGRVAVAKPDAPDSLAIRSTDEEIFLSPGQRLRMQSHASPTIDYPSIEQETGWMRGQMYFKNTQLVDAVNEVNRYNRILRVSVVTSVSQCRIGGVFRAGDTASFARGVAATCNLSIVRNANTLTLEPRARTR